MNQQSRSFVMMVAWGSRFMTSPTPHPVTWFLTSWQSIVAHPVPTLYCQL